MPYSYPTRPHMLLPPRSQTSLSLRIKEVVLFLQDHASSSLFLLFFSDNRAAPVCRDCCKRPNHIFFLWGQSVILWINLYGQLLLKFPNQAAGQRAMLAQSRQRQAGEPPPLLPSELFNNCRKGSAAPFASYHPQPNSLGAWLLQLLSYLNISRQHPHYL
jgi:hypothetical protein